MLDPKRFKLSGVNGTASLLARADVAPDTTLETRLFRFIVVAAVCVEAPVRAEEVTIEAPAVLDTLNVLAAAPTGVG
jgi:hypothetical protein